MTVILDAAASLTLKLGGVKLIEASAGTGKTHAIANLYLRHILSGLRSAEILVVSFTNAATDELLQRIQKRLVLAQQAFRGMPTEDEFLNLLQAQHLALDPEQQQLQLHRLQYALRSMDEAMILTIHGFCFAVLQDHALLSQQAFDSEVLPNDDEFYESALRDWWRANVYPLNAKTWAVFTRAIPSLDHLLGRLRRLRNHPGDQILPQTQQSLAQILGVLSELDDEEAIDTALPELTATILSESRQYAARSVAQQKRDHACLAYQDLLDRLLAAFDGTTGETLIDALRSRFPAAMIDEFQDTDPIQFEIFRRLYFGRTASSLILIGDPKQAIYGFRGGDIFTYIGARQAPEIEIYALQTNWRSEPDLIDATNHMFTQREQAFIYDQAIAFHPAIPSERMHNEDFNFAQTKSSALTIWKLPLRENGKTFSMQEMQTKLVEALVSEIATLLDPANGACIGEQSLQNGDIAVLVRERSEGEALRQALARTGIRAVTIGREQVFHSDEARGLYELLDGIAHPRDSQSQHRALASNLFALDYLQLAQNRDDDDRWQAWIDCLLSLHELWLKHGFITMYQQMLQQLDPLSSLASQAFAERKLTNLGHLAELLHQQSRTHAGIDALLSWYRQQLDQDGNDTSELRLESDADLIKIVTVHKSKGLEYPVVFLPFLWRCKRATWRPSMLRFHDQDAQAWVDVGSEDFAQHGCLAEKERLAEDLRLLYVALTRARSKVYLAWGDAGDGRASGQPKHSALAWLLHSRQSAADLETQEPQGFDDAASLYAELDAFAASRDSIEVVDLPPATTSTPAPPLVLAKDIPIQKFSRHFDIGWQIGSFSGLTRDVHQVAHSGERMSRGDAILDFPAGSHIGLLLHELLETLDFQQDIAEQCQARIVRTAPGYGIHQAQQQQTLLTWLGYIIDTPLDSKELRLSSLANRQRLNELKFDFALDQFDVDTVNRLMQADVAIPLQTISGIGFRGLITGIIDLVFEYQGKYYLADYKSNFLGARLEDYVPARLQQVVYDRRYDLQAMLYAIALHRYLEQRIPDYQYEQHFGGCYYLFVRAMRPESGARFGIHFERPTQHRIDTLDRALGFHPQPVPKP